MMTELTGHLVRWALLSSELEVSILAILTMALKTSYSLAWS